MANLLFLACLVLLCHATDIRVRSVISKGADGAYEDCPCKALDTDLYGNFSALGSNLPSNYGSTCYAWDSLANGWETCRVASPPSFCFLKWCYIEASNCRRPYVPSVALADVSYSWATCGSINFLDRSLPLSAELKHGLIFSGLSAPQPGDSSGLAIFTRYARLLLEEMGINPDTQVIHYEISGDGKEIMNTNSTYTACVYDLAVGLIDACLYDFWLTQDRINTGAVPIGVYQDTFFLWVSENPEESFWQMLSKPFLPFSGELWGLIALVLVMNGFAMSCFQEGVRNSLCSPLRIAEHTHLSFLGFFSGGVVNDYYYNTQLRRLRPASKLMMVGFSFFSLIAIASFTGSTALFLLNNVAKPSISSIEDALHNGRLTICYPEEVSVALLAKYPKLEGLGIPIGWQWDRPIFQDVKEGVCDVAIASYSYSIVLEEACGFKPVGPLVHSLSVGFFVSHELSQHFLFHNSKLKQIGEWAKLEKEMLEPHPCQETDEDEDVNAMQLKATHMMPSCLVLILCALAGTALHFFKRTGQALSRRSEKVARLSGKLKHKFSGRTDLSGSSGSGNRHQILGNPASPMMRTQQTQSTAITQTSRSLECSEDMRYIVGSTGDSAISADISQCPDDVRQSPDDTRQGSVAKPIEIPEAVWSELRDMLNARMASIEEDANPPQKRSL